MKYTIIYFLLIFTYSASLNAGWNIITPDKVSERLLSLSFVSPDTGFAVGWGSERSVFLTTKDGGLSWSVSSFPGKYIFNVKAYNASEIYLSGFASSCLCGIIMKSSDGGKNWTDIEFNDAGNPYSFGILKFIKKPDSSFIVSGYNGGIFYSTNSGYSWISSDTKAGSEVFRYIDFPTNKTGYAVSGDDFNFQTKLYKSTNYGDTWFSVFNFNDINTYINYIHFFNADSGLVAGISRGKEAILETTDGGLNWNYIYLGDDTFSIVSMSIQHNDIFYAVNDEGKIIRSVDSGKVWTLAAMGFDKSVNDAVVFEIDSLPYAYSVGFGLVAKYDIINHVDYTSDNKRYIVYPNPAKDYLVINLNNISAKYEFSVYDLFGILVKKIELNNNFSYIKISDLNTGFYIYKITGQEKLLHSGRFIKY